MVEKWLRYFIGADVKNVTNYDIISSISILSIYNF